MFRKLLKKSLPVILVLLAGRGAEASGQVTVNGKSQLEVMCPDPTKEPCKTAKKMIVSAGVIVTGEEVTDEEWGFMAAKMLSSPEVGEAKFAAGLSLSDAVAGWKAWLASPFTGDGNRTKVINAAYMEVYGVLPLAIERDVWMKRIKAQEAWYAIIVSKEISGLNSADARRRDMITRAYNHAFGRPANDTEDMPHWLPRKEHYRPLIQAQRQWLYSERGAKDLWFAAEKALTAKYKKQPSPAEVNAAVEKFRPGRLIYIEMVKAA